LVIDKSILSKVCLLENKLQTVDSDILDCCASVQSKIDELTETVNLVDENLNACCNNIVSKLESLDQDVTIDESILSKVCDLHRCLIEDGGCCEIPICLTDRVRFIQSKTCTILSKMNDLESKINEIVVDTGLDETILSRIEDLDTDLAECCEGLTSNIDSCCFTLNSKIDL